jgi:hypothetical protein
MPDGSSQDSLGNYNSGVIYLTRPGDTIYNFASHVTLWGATGRIRGWRLKQARALPPGYNNDTRKQIVRNAFIAARLSR